MAWIHEHSDWPEFRWNHEMVAVKLGSVRHRQGQLVGRMQSLGFDLQQEAGLDTLTADAVTTSAIEGERLNEADVRSSIARRLGLDAGGLGPRNRSADGIVDVLLDATREYRQPLSGPRLCSWHAALFPTGRSGIRAITVGEWRTDATGPMQVISGPMGRETVQFEAPAAHRLPHEMERFLSWFNEVPAIDPVVHAAIAHFWFVTIHSFDDGNGRIARAIADMALARADGSPERYYSMSSQIESERSAYYEQLQHHQQASLDISGWIEWFIDCLGCSLERAEASLSAVLARARFWQAAAKYPLNDRQRAVLHRMLGDFAGHLNTSKYAKLAQCSTDTALRDIRELLQWGLVVRNPGGGRSTSYSIAG